MTKFGTGWRKNERDGDDYKFERMGVTPSSDPTNPDLTSHIRIVRNQSITSSCVGQAIVGALDIRKDIKGVYKKPASALFPYWFGRNLENNGINDNGSHPRNVMKAVVKLGLPDEDIFPFDADKVNEKPHVNACLQAISRRGGTYAFLDCDRSSRPYYIKAALLKKLPVIFGTQITPKFEDYSKGILSRPSGTDLLLGGHMLCCVGMYGSVYHILNSWGTWGEEGLCWIDESYMTWKYTDDICIVTGYELIA